MEFELINDSSKLNKIEPGTWVSVFVNNEFYFVSPGNVLYNSELEQIDDQELGELIASNATPEVAEIIGQCW